VKIKSSSGPTVLLLERIASALPGCSPAQVQVGKLLLKDPKGFVRLPIAELARLAKVSKPTIVRFCREIGYAGLADFKLKLASVLNGGIPYVHQSVSIEDPTEILATKVVDNSVSALLHLRSQLSAPSMEKATAALLNSIHQGRRIEFYGVGNSGIVAQDAQHKFFRLGCNTVAYADPHMQIMAATLLQPGDCAVIISNSGRMRDLLETQWAVKRQGATAIAITATGSPLAKTADILLAADHREDFDRYSPMVSRMLHLMLIDILVTAVATHLGPTLVTRLAAIKRNLKIKYKPDPS
jgi:RpiR family carbohydrate utilization transcriptional regulator